MRHQDPDESPESAASRPTEYPPRTIGRRQADETNLRDQHALGSSEARYRLLVDSVRDYAIFMLGPNGHVTTWNRGAERILGYRPEETIGKHVEIFHSPSDRDLGLASEHLRLAEHFGRFEEEGWRMQKDGERFWAHDTISALFDDSGLLGFAVVMRDLSERRRAEEDLREHSQQLAKVVETQQRIAVTALEVGASMESVIARVGTLIRADGTAIALVEGDALVYRMASGIGENYRGMRLDLNDSRAGETLKTGQWIRSGDSATDVRIDRAMSERDGIGSMILVPLFYDGRWIGVLDIVYTAANAFTESDLDTLQLLSGQIAAAMSHALSFQANRHLIFERTQALESVRQNEERFRSLIENASDTIEIVDRNLLVLYASPAAERLWGYPPKELHGRSLGAFIHADDLSRFEVGVREILDNPGVTVMLELRMHHRSNTWRSMSVVLRNLLADPGVNGLVVTSRDVTDQNALAAQLRQAQRMDAVGRLAGGIAHDFNNLLTVIKGNIELMRLDVDATSPVLTEVEEIRKATERAAGLTRQLLAFSRKQLLRRRPVDINEIVEEVEPMLRRLIGEDVQIATSLAPAIPPVLADPGQLHQVLMNLALNARDAMANGGLLRIETSVINVDDAYLLTHPGVRIKLGEYAQLAVTDTGTGMSEEVRGQLFEPFFTTKEAGHGTGLGLSTVYGIVKQSDGFVWAASEIGKGTTFLILLPAVAASVTVERPIPVSESEIGGSETVLLVEDEAPLRALTQRLLERHGYRVLSATDGRDALEIASSHDGAIDLIVTDVVMPGMSGRDLAERVGAIRPHSRLLYISGYTDDEIIRRGLLDPNLALLEKPFSSRQLAQAVRRVLDAPTQAPAVR